MFVHANEKFNINIACEFNVSCSDSLYNLFIYQMNRKKTKLCTTVLKIEKKKLDAVAAWQSFYGSSRQRTKLAARSIKN